MKRDDFQRDSTYGYLAIVGAISLVAFAALFVNIPWQWSMFMDDTMYNQWMPAVTDLRATLVKEIREYWALGRFYPVKYLANLLKWRYLAHDPYAFRYFNFSVYLAAAAFAGLAGLRATAGGHGWPRRWAFAAIVFALGSSVLHKPLLEIISLNPIGETWVCLFLAMGAYCLFAENAFVRYGLARFFFALMALSKEPAALVFLAASAHYFFLAWAERDRRGKNFAQAVIDLLLFTAFFSLALYTMSQGSFTKGAYFHTTPWMQYLHDFLYRVARYALWTSPFVLGFALSYRELGRTFSRQASRLSAGALFFGLFAAGYMVFMSTQGIVAYQETPSSMALFCLFTLVTFALLQSGALAPLVGRFGALLLLCFCVSYFISVTRWERFVRGIVEPRQAMENLIHTTDGNTLLIPLGEISGHVDAMIHEGRSKNKFFPIHEHLFDYVGQFQGRVFVLEFPYYMGPLDPGLLQKIEQEVGGWKRTIDAKTYRIYVGEKVYPVRP